MFLVRKISIGANYKDAMHFYIGQDVIRGKATIESININADKTVVDLYIKSNGEVHLWKTFINMPVTVENQIEIE